MRLQEQLTCCPYTSYRCERCISVNSAPQFDMARGTTVDYMHCCLLGVVKMLLTLWLDIKHRDAPWSLRKHQHILDQRLLSVKPPNFIHRQSRSLEDTGNGSFRNPLLSTVLLYLCFTWIIGYLPDVYFKRQHYVLLVQAMYLLLLDSISLTDVKKARKMIKAFCVQIEGLYGARYQTFNVHSLLHLCDKVLDLTWPSLVTVLFFL